MPPAPVDDREDVKEDRIEDRIKDIVKVTGVKFRIRWDKSAVRKYNPLKLPTCYIIDRSGVVKHIHAGYEAGEEVKAVTRSRC